MHDLSIWLNALSKAMVSKHRSSSEAWSHLPIEWQPLGVPKRNCMGARVASRVLGVRRRGVSSHSNGVVLAVLLLQSCQ